MNLKDIPFGKVYLSILNRYVDLMDYCYLGKVKTEDLTDRLHTRYARGLQYLSINAKDSYIFGFNTDNKSLRVYPGGGLDEVKFNRKNMMVFLSALKEIKQYLNEEAIEYDY